MNGSAEDKTVWIKRLLSKDIVVNTVYTEQKPEFCKGKDCISIDDLEENIDKWDKAGGTGILYTNAPDTINNLKELGIL